MVPQVYRIRPELFEAYFRRIPNLWDKFFSNGIRNDLRNRKMSVIRWLNFKYTVFYAIPKYNRLHSSRLPDNAMTLLRYFDFFLKCKKLLNFSALQRFGKKRIGPRESSLSLWPSNKVNIYHHQDMFIFNKHIISIFVSCFWYPSRWLKISLTWLPRTA